MAPFRICAALQKLDVLIDLACLFFKTRMIKWMWPSLVPLIHKKDVLILATSLYALLFVQAEVVAATLRREPQNPGTRINHMQGSRFCLHLAQLRASGTGEALGIFSPMSASKPLPGHREGSCELILTAWVIKVGKLCVCGFCSTWAKAHWGLEARGENQRKTPEALRRGFSKLSTWWRFLHEWACWIYSWVILIEVSRAGKTGKTNLGQDL